jgi:hypothetical protein
MAKVDRGTPTKEYDPLEGYTLREARYFIHALPTYRWDEISDCNVQDTSERQIFGPYETKDEAQSDLDFLVANEKYTKEQIIIRKKGLYEYTKTVWLPMVLD